MPAPSPEAQRQLTLVEQYMNPGVTDAAQLEAGMIGPDGLPYPVEGQPFPVEGQPDFHRELDQQHTEEAKHLAEIALRDAERNALENQRRNAGATGTNLFAAAEKVEQDHNVSEAHRKLDEVFATGGAAEVAEKAAKDAIGLSGFEKTKSTDRVARDIALNQSPLQTLKHEVSGPVQNRDKTANQLAALEDKYNGNAKHMLRRVSERVKRNLKKIGISSKTTELDSQVAEAGGVQVAQTDQAVRVKQQVEGRKIIDALSGQKPRLSTTNRERLVDSFKQSGELVHLSDAVARRRSGGSVSYRTAQNIGRAYERAQGSEASKAA